jgi:hypothetical protein
LYLLKEISERTKSKIVEANNDGEKKYYIEGIFIQAEKQNKNNRIYPIGIIKEEVARYNKDMIQTKRAMGELTHPEHVEVDLKQVSHIIESLTFQGTDVYGRAKLLDTPNGKIGKALMKEGVNFGVSTRGLGSVSQKNGIFYVDNDFFLTAIDIVSDPSAPDAFVTSLVENKQWVWENGVIKEKQINKYKQTIKKANKKNLKETFVFVFEDFMSNLSKK